MTWWFCIILAFHSYGLWIGWWCILVVCHSTTMLWLDDMLCTTCLAFHWFPSLNPFGVSLIGFHIRLWWLPLGLSSILGIIYSHFARCLEVHWHWCHLGHGLAGKISSNHWLCGKSVVMTSPAGRTFKYWSPSSIPPFVVYTLEADYMPLRSSTSWNTRCIGGMWIPRCFSGRITWRATWSRCGVCHRVGSWNHSYF
jgi:hypothetical protein